jgi:hypothetical protein
VGVSHQTIANWLAARPAPGTSRDIGCYPEAPAR